MGITITYHGYNNPVYSASKNVVVHHTRQNTDIWNNNPRRKVRSLVKCTDIIT